MRYEVHVSKRLTQRVRRVIELGGDMDHAQPYHYHIRWYDEAILDWECFSTPEDATARAKLLAHSGEGYAVEEHDRASGATK